jgi:hypothetical protein
MSATAEDQERLDLEEVLASLLDAEEHWRCAALRLTQRMRTLDESEILAELNAGRVAVVKAKTALAQRHPNHRR